jgi:hypothetical protein
VGLATAGGLAEIAAGVLGTAATWVASTWVASAWVASTGSRAAGEGAQTPRLVGACERQARGFLGARCAAWLAVKAFSHFFLFIKSVGPFFEYPTRRRLISIVKLANPPWARHSRLSRIVGRYRWETD